MALPTTTIIWKFRHHSPIGVLTIIGLCSIFSFPTVAFCCGKSSSHAKGLSLAQDGSILHEQKNVPWSESQLYSGGRNTGFKSNVFTYQIARAKFQLSLNCHDYQKSLNRNFFFLLFFKLQDLHLTPWFLLHTGGRRAIEKTSLGWWDTVCICQ